MTIRKTGKIWLGVGAMALLGGAAPRPTQAADPATPAATAAPNSAAASDGGAHPEHAKQSGPAAPKVMQGGEGGEGSGGGLDPRVKFFRDMSLVHGHLLVGDELVKAGLWSEALPHFHHPVEELYPAIGPKLKGQGIRQFDSALKALAQTVQSKNINAYANARSTVEQRMVDVDKGMRKFADPFVPSRLATILAVLKSAASEYEEAIEDGRIAKPVEYQDSRGFVFYAERMLESVAKDLEKTNPQALASTRAAFTELKSAWPTAVPPANPVKLHAAVVADVARVELALDPWLKK